MGQKGSPIGFRLVIRKKWQSNWYANKQEFGDLLEEDRLIRKFLEKQPACVGSAGFTIKRTSGKIEVTIHTARPGLVIGKKGAEIDVLKNELKKITNKEVWIEVEEIKRPDLSAKLVAESIAKQIERRVPFRRALKKAIQTTMDAGATGIKVQVSGRIGGAEIARTEWYKDGRIPLHTLRADIDYGVKTARTSYGAIGVKVWINKGEEVI
ncbi:MAG: 30S ribosomal protein S3 [Candidatus Anoxychlamydiales bacterium]|uniref:KH type-2 domain-containing protein n=1 Tax=marine sediment metagenome TaxID=412755 RepID=A0A0F9ISV9_9ZZZZ|nr:30S ribosomal protein S3 [Candidatus Anoxychlamydiales bacterium]